MILNMEYAQPSTISKLTAKQALICPECSTPLSGLTAGVSALDCGGCQQSFEIADNIVFFLPKTEESNTKPDEFVSFDAHAAYYESTRYGDDFKPELAIDIISENIALDGDSLVLDLGGGTGVFSKPFASRGQRIVTSDISLPMLEIYSRKLSREEMNFALCLRNDARKIPLGDNSADCILERHVINLIADWQQVLSEIKRVLKPAGALFLLLDGDKTVLSTNFDESGVNRLYWKYLTEEGQTEAERPGITIPDLIEHLKSAAELCEVGDQRLAYNKIRTLDDIVFDMSRRTGTKQRFIDPDSNQRAVEKVLEELRGTYGESFGSLAQQERHSLKILKVVF